MCKIILIIVLSSSPKNCTVPFTLKLILLRGLTNYELAVRLRNGDLDAFNTLYWKYHAALYLNVIKLTKDAGLTEDIVQEVFITLWEKRSGIMEDQSIAGWLFTVSYHKSVDALKRKFKEASVIKLFVVPQEEPENADLSDAQINILNKALEQLSPQKSKVFTLCKIEGKSYEQASVQLNISKHTVKEYLSEAVKSVKVYLHNHPELKTSMVVVLLIKQLVPFFYF